MDESDFVVPADLVFNREAIADPGAFAHDAGAQSWLYLCGEEFAAMDQGMSYDQVQAAVPVSENVVADPPRPFDLDAVRTLVGAIDRLPRPTLVTCRTGPRSSAAVYVYAGLQAGASPEQVLARADADDAPFARVDALRDLVTQGLEALGPEQ
jgi:protein tyrosine phosphatase (PTP) superfamily phosphohydrolase (DUF442 family)